MQGHQISPTAQVIAFPVNRVARRDLTANDRIDAFEWSVVVRHFGYDRIVVHEYMPNDPPELGSFIALYRPGHAFATWNLARNGGEILVWDSVTSQDFGRFASMHAAIGAVMRAEDPQSPRLLPPEIPRSGRNVVALRLRKPCAG